MREGVTFKHNVDLQQLFEDIVTSAQIAEVPYDTNIIWNVLNAYRSFWNSAVTFRTTTKPKEKRTLNVRYCEVDVLHDPYRIALGAGLLRREKHPIESLYSETRERFPMDGTGGYGIDFGVNYGIEKIWPFFNGCQPLEELYKVPSLPDSVRSHAGYFAKYGLSTFTLLALDYRHKSVNLYCFNTMQLTTETIAEMISDAGLALPSQDILERCAKPPCIYFTFTWESPNIERICCPNHGTAGDIPTHYDPLMERWVAKAPFVIPERVFLYNPTLSRTGDYIKIENDYNGKMGRLLFALAVSAAQAQAS